MSDQPTSADQGAQPAPGRRALVLAVLALVVIAIGARWVLADDPKLVTESHESDTATATRTLKGPGLSQIKSGSRQLAKKVPDAPDPTVEAPEDWRQALPFVTEGGLALLLGVGLGLASRAAAKLLAVLALLFFAGMQYFAYEGVVVVDYAALMDWVRRFVLNVGGQDLFADLSRKLPALGSLGVGYLIGLKR